MLSLSLLLFSECFMFAINIKLRDENNLDVDWILWTMCKFWYVSTINVTPSQELRITLAFVLSFVSICVAYQPVIYDDDDACIIYYSKWNQVIITLMQAKVKSQAEICILLHYCWGSLFSWTRKHFYRTKRHLFLPESVVNILFSNFPMASDSHTDIAVYCWHISVTYHISRLLLQIHPLYFILYFSFSSLFLTNNPCLFPPLPHTAYKNLIG